MFDKGAEQTLGPQPVTVTVSQQLAADLDSSASSLPSQKWFSPCPSLPPFFFTYPACPVGGAIVLWLGGRVFKLAVLMLAYLAAPNTLSESDVPQQKPQSLRWAALEPSGQEASPHTEPADVKETKRQPMFKCELYEARLEVWKMCSWQRTPSEFSLLL